MLLEDRRKKDSDDFLGIEKSFWRTVKIVRTLEMRSGAHQIIVDGFKRPLRQ